MFNCSSPSRSTASSSRPLPDFLRTRSRDSEAQSGPPSGAHAADDAGAAELRLQLQQVRAAAAQREANLQAELDFIKNERSQAHKRADLHSRQMIELQVIEHRPGNVISRKDTSQIWLTRRLLLCLPTFSLSQIQLRSFQQAQEGPFLQETRHEIDGLRGALTEARTALATSEELASEAQVTSHPDAS